MNILSFLFLTSKFGIGSSNWLAKHPLDAKLLNNNSPFLTKEGKHSLLYMQQLTFYHFLFDIQIWNWIIKLTRQASTRCKTTK